MGWIWLFVVKITMWIRGTNLCINCTGSVFFCNKFHAVTKRSQMHPNTMKHTKTWVLGPMGWISFVCWEKLQCDFVVRNFVLIAPVQYVLHQLSCAYETIPNAPKYYEMHRNISLGSNRLDGVRFLWKITTRLRGTNFCINYTSSVCFATSFMQLRNDRKCMQIL